MPKIKAIIFDWGGVFQESGSKKLLPFLAKKYNLNEKKFIAFWSREDDKANLGAITSRSFFREMKHDFKIPLSEIEYDRIYLNAKKLKKPMIKIAKSLKERYKLAVLSNTNKKDYVHDIKDRVPIKDIFNVVIVSSIYRTKKPGKKIYKICLKKLSVRASEAVFIDDKLENVIAAKKLGIHAIHFTSYGKLKRELKNLGVKV